MQAEKVKNKKKALYGALSVLMLLLIFLSPGCGGVRYKLPKGKTLFYEFATSRRIVEEDKVVERGEERRAIEIRLKVRQSLPQGYACTISAHGMEGARHSVVGESLGSLKFMLDKKGRVFNATGMGLPSALDIKRFLLELPRGSVRPGRKWNDVMGMDFLGIPREVDIETTYTGIERYSGRPCHHFLTEGTFQITDVVNKPEYDLLVDVTVNYIFEQHNYLSKKGYPLYLLINDGYTVDFVERGTGETKRREATQKHEYIFMRME
ncbi:MAG TPA: hypothetical protein PLN69_00415 [bacterium]|nr:hypothetical protein [bacterium]